jgi:ubiquinone/menaquinone biosynthesis C-methylase UbiE
MDPAAAAGDRLMAAPDAQAAVDAFFDNDAPNWQGIYEQVDIFSVIHQHRQRLALDWVKSLRLSPGGRVLEVGCGAGLLAAAMAESGLDVVATDSTQAMLDLARRNAERCGVHVSLRRLDVHHLDDGAPGYDLVVALGVIPWLHSPEIALAEMSRVLRPGGYLIANADNSARLQSLIDPLFSPPLARPRQVGRWIINRGRSRRAAGMPPTVRHSARQFDQLLSRAGLARISGISFGFGPFTFWGRRVLGEPASVRLHRRLQAMADRGAPVLRSTGAQYIVLARKGALPA